LAALLVVVRFAGDFLAADVDLVVLFFAALRAGLFFAVDFVAVDLVAGDFLAVDLVAGDFLAVDFLAAAFVVVLFLTGAFFAVLFLEAVVLFAEAFLAAFFAAVVALLTTPLLVFLAGLFFAAVDLVAVFLLVVFLAGALAALLVVDFFAVDFFAGDFLAVAFVVAATRVSVSMSRPCVGLPVAGPAERPSCHDLDNINARSEPIHTTGVRVVLSPSVALSKVPRCAPRTFALHTRENRGDVRRCARVQGKFRPLRPMRTHGPRPAVSREDRRTA
jgi:hypothetical protein